MGELRFEFMQGIKTLRLLSFWLIFFLLFGETTLRLLDYRPGILLQPQELKNTWINLDGEAPELIDLFEPDSFGLLKPKIPLSNTVLSDSLIYLPLKEKLSKTRINQDGFRSNKFDHIPGDKVKILFLGDSFTFGFDANPFDSCFVDQLEQLNPCFYPLNGGIPGGDLATYAKVAELYIPKVNPLFVVIPLYANDMVYYPKEMIPNRINNIYMTDKGILFKENYQYKKDSIQVFADHKEAYHALLSDYTTKYIDPSALKWLLDRSVFLAQIYEWLDIRCHRRFGTIKKKENYSKTYTQKIKNLALAHDAIPIFTIIPHRSNLNPEKNRVFFQQMVDDTLYFPHGIRECHYGLAPRIHFNNQGHAFYARFINELINQKID